MEAISNEPAAFAESRLLSMATPPNSRDHLDPSETIADLGINSLQSLELILEMEERFGIHLTDGDIGSIVTVGDLVTLINRNSPASPSTIPK